MIRNVAFRLFVFFIFYFFNRRPCQLFSQLRRCYLQRSAEKTHRPRWRCSAQARRACEQRVLSTLAAPRGSLLQAGPGPGPGYPFQPAAIGKRRGRDRIAWGGVTLPGPGFFFFSLPDWETAGHVTVFPGAGRAAGSPSCDFPDREIHASPPFTSRPSTASRPVSSDQTLDAISLVNNVLTFFAKAKKARLTCNEGVFIKVMLKTW
ncbi:hypothetical protein NDU88_006012 [Pleurodeles waltl]|uniref:Uncharacterized protein n=1 Tax=Pleurodeles waltl TaxID=8319 RepID=A0AAV7LP92_PLEWA|nr:hypothetical protein NDU88_006012 [Pleurodeles waltl]